MRGRMSAGFLFLVMRYVAMRIKLAMRTSCPQLPRLFVSCAAWLVLVPAVLAQRPLPPPRPTRPNILLIVVDDVGIENLACYGFGSQPAVTPHINHLARAGLLFRNAWSNPVCSGTRASMLTGRYGFRTGVGFLVDSHGHDGLPAEEITFVELLARSGYRCGLAGKWHLGNERHMGPASPLANGFSFYAGSLSEKFRRMEHYDFWTKVVNHQAGLCTRYNTTEIVSEALCWIGRQHDPWMCCVSFNAAHTPLHAPPAHLHGYQLAPLNRHRQPRTFYLAAVQAMATTTGDILFP